MSFTVSECSDEKNVSHSQHSDEESIDEECSDLGGMEDSLCEDGEETNGDDDLELAPDMLPAKRQGLPSSLKSTISEIATMPIPASRIFGIHSPEASFTKVLLRELAVSEFPPMPSKPLLHYRESQLKLSSIGLKSGEYGGRKTTSRKASLFSETVITFGRYPLQAFIGDSKVPEVANISDVLDLPSFLQKRLQSSFFSIRIDPLVDHVKIDKNEVDM
ncbi:uncharacterized protein F5147DRAFT_657770 [Suillus discolor]|uniref:Uncharacterized protein n=1 Tax=Suillus discolor TaxID=1912936 RepID=A0A9P7EVY9_9AGAM|nr:uncharacterized protein F5147DRAFT_657770 [Suillus discolor]KAG2092155.1 hypothetical protein F5147DRAFT_657770 [Suillus discolor]